MVRNADLSWGPKGNGQVNPRVALRRLKPVTIGEQTDGRPTVLPLRVEIGSFKSAALFNLLNNESRFCVLDYTTFFYRFYLFYLFIFVFLGCYLGSHPNPLPLEVWIKGFDVCIPFLSWELAFLQDLHLQYRVSVGT